MTEQDDEEETTRRPARPSAYWARVREQEGAGYSSDFRGVKQGPHGGQQRVKPEDIIGDYDTCWCGQPADHDWPGKSSGRKHPKEQSVSVSNTTTPETEVPHITRNELGGFSESYVEIILKAVNDYRVRYRMSNKGILLYPHDGSTPYSLPKRENPRTLRSTRLWFVKHVADPETEATMERLRQSASVEDAARVLAEALNSPEHQVEKEPRPATKTAVPRAATGTCPDCGMETRTANGVTKHRLTNKVECVNTPAPVEEQQPPRLRGQSSPEVEAQRSTANQDLYDRMDAQGAIPPLTEGRTIWHPQSASYENPLYETDGETIYCRVKDCGFTTLSGKGASGHMVKHDPEGRGAKMWGSDAQVKKRETRNHSRTTAQITEAVEILNKALGIVPEKVSKADEKALATAIKERDKAIADAAKMAVARDEWKGKYGDLKAKLDLLKDL